LILHSSKASTRLPTSSDSMPPFRRSD